MKEVLCFVPEANRHSAVCVHTIIFSSCQNMVMIAKLPIWNSFQHMSSFKVYPDMIVGMVV